VGVTCIVRRIFNIFVHSSGVFVSPGYRSRGPGFDSRCYQIFWEVVGQERGPLSLASTIEELLGRNNSGLGLENKKCGRGDPLRWPRDTLCQQKLALISPTAAVTWSVQFARWLRPRSLFMILVLNNISVQPSAPVVMYRVTWSRGTWENNEEMNIWAVPIFEVAPSGIAKGSTTEGSELESW
jgi:hypothetical protein